MNAHITVKNVILCPYCESSKYTITRRAIRIDNKIENSCRCEHCSEEFKYSVDKYGTPYER